MVMVQNDSCVINESLAYDPIPAMKKLLAGESDPDEDMDEEAFHAAVEALDDFTWDPDVYGTYA